MKKIIFLSIFAVILLSCNKNTTNEKNTHITNASILKESKKSISAWKTEISTNDFIMNSMDEFPSNLQSLFEDSKYLTYIIVNNQGVFQEYIVSIDNKKRIQLSNFLMKDNVNQDYYSFFFTENNEKLYINNIEIIGLIKFHDFNKLMSETVELRLPGCCDACYLVHSVLGLHDLDCLCCLGTCGFSCGTPIDVTSNGESLKSDTPIGEITLGWVNIK